MYLFISCILIVPLQQRRAVTASNHLLARHTMPTRRASFWLLELFVFQLSIHQFNFGILLLLRVHVVVGFIAAAV